MTRTIDFYFDFPSPYSYLAHTQLPRIAAEHNASVIYRPFRILELMKLVGNRPTTVECKNKGKYAGTDLQRWTKRYNVDFARNPHSRSFDFAELDRGALVAIADGRGAEYVTAVFSGIWAKQADLSQRLVLIDILNRAGFNAPLLLERASTEDITAKLDSETQAAAMRGVFGAPDEVIE
jgi:2-hydroxychromene-2-carboxylate isomerase